MKIPPNTPNKTKEKPIEAQKPIIFAKSNDLISKTKEGIADIYTASQELHPAGGLPADDDRRSGVRQWRVRESARCGPRFGS